MLHDFAPDLLRRQVQSTRRTPAGVNESPVLLVRAHRATLQVQLNVTHQYQSTVNIDLRG